MSWEFTMLFVHIAALCGLVMLYRSPPCWMQRLVVVLFGLSMLLLSSSGVLALNGYGLEGRQLVRVALALEHVGVLLWVFRVIYWDKVQWTSSPRSRSS